MLPKIVDARPAGNYKVWLRFADGLSGEVDLASEMWGEVFESLKDQAIFAQLRVDPDLDTIVWPNGADLSPQWLHDRLTETVKVTSAA